MKVVIIGNGAAGFSAAKRLRSTDSGMQVTLVDHQELPLYTKIRLPDYIAGGVGEEKLFITTFEEYDRLGIERLFGERVERLDSLKKILTMASGRSLSYDVLLLATGAQAAIPRIDGIYGPGVFSLRTIADARTIIEKLKSVDAAVIIGGGLLGLEVAHAMKTKGLAVSVIEFFPQLLPKNLTDDEAAILLEKLRSTGLNIYLDRITSKIEREDGRLLVRTHKGDVIKTGLVLVSAGIQPEVSLAKVSGIKVDKGIVVNERLSTSATDVYAVGDCAEVNGFIQGLWVAAKEQGEAVAEIILGRQQAYNPTLFTPLLKVSSINLKDIKTEAAQRRAAKLL